MADPEQGPLEGWDRTEDSMASFPGQGENTNPMQNVKPPSERPRPRSQPKKKSVSVAPVASAEPEGSSRTFPARQVPGARPSSARARAPAATSPRVENAKHRPASARPRPKTPGDDSVSAGPRPRRRNPLLAGDPKNLRGANVPRPQTAPARRRSIVPADIKVPPHPGNLVPPSGPNLQETLDDVVRRCVVRDEEFQDTTFPAEPASVFGRDMPPDEWPFSAPVWHRPKDVLRVLRHQHVLHGEEINQGDPSFQPSIWSGKSTVKPYLFRVTENGDINPADIIQGSLDDGWFLGALGSIARRTGKLVDIVAFSDLSDTYGVYGVRFYKNGVWQNVIIDDRVPCDGMTGMPLFARSSDPCEIWVSLIEKAYAKLHGSYFALNGGSAGEALVDITGGTQFSYNVWDDLDRVESGAFWNDLKDAVSDDNHLVVVRDDQLVPRGTTVAGNILANTPYAVHGIHQSKLTGRKLVQLSCPFGGGVWTGPWGPGAMDWKRNPGILNEIPRGAPGAFWMPYESFIETFNMAHACLVFSVRWNRVMWRGAWNSRSAGGNELEPTWCNNPQFRITIRRPSTLYVSLMEREVRGDFGRHAVQDGVAPSHPLLAFSLFKNPDRNLRKWEPPVSKDEAVFTTSPRRNREVTGKVNISPETTYILVAQTQYAGYESPFTLRIWGDHEFEIEPVFDVFETSLNGEWNLNNSGGKRFESSWCTNPQIHMKIIKKTRARLILRRTDLPPLIPHRFLKAETESLVAPSDVRRCCINVSKTEASMPKHSEWYIKFLGGGKSVSTSASEYTKIPQWTESHSFSCSDISRATLKAELWAQDLVDGAPHQSFHGEVRLEMAGLEAGEHDDFVTIMNDRDEQIGWIRIIYTLDIDTDTKEVDQNQAEAQDEEAKDGALVAIGFTIIRVRSDQPDTILRVNPEEIIDETSFLNTHTAIATPLLEEGNYIIIPTMSEPGAKGVFKLTCYSSFEARLAMLPSTRHKTIVGKWDARCSGGSHLNDNFKANPQFFVKLEQPSTEPQLITITLSRMRKGTHRKMPSLGILGKDTSKRISKEAKLLEASLAGVVSQIADQERELDALKRKLEQTESAVKENEGKSEAVAIAGKKTGAIRMEIQAVEETIVDLEAHAQSLRGEMQHHESMLKEMSQKKSQNMMKASWNTSTPLDWMIGFYVYLTDAAEPTPLPLSEQSTMDMLLYESPFLPVNELQHEFVLPEGETSFVVVPTTYAPKKHSHFIMMCSLDHDNTFSISQTVPRSKGSKNH